MKTLLFLLLIIVPFIVYAKFIQGWLRHWMKFSELGRQRSTSTMKKIHGTTAALSVVIFIMNTAVIVWYCQSSTFDAHWLGWVLAVPLLLASFSQALLNVVGFVGIMRGPSIEYGLYQWEKAQLDQGKILNNACFICKKQDHRREMILMGCPGSMECLQEVGRDPKKRWDPAQKCFECGSCGRLVCHTHSDVDMRCECGACDWRQRTYVQQELDNGEPFSSLPRTDGQQLPASSTRNGLKPFVEGLLKNKPDLVSQGIQGGVDVNMLLGEGGETTPLVLSAHKGNILICGALLEAGANPNQRNKRGHLALCEVLANAKLSVKERLQIARLLLEHGADSNGLDWGRPAIQFAMESEQLIALLLEHGADTNQVSAYHELDGPRQGQNYQYHENAIRYACKLGAMPEVIKVLLAAGADPLLPNSEGDTAWDFVCNFLHKAPNEPIPSGREGAEKRMIIQARTALYEETASLLKPVVMAACFDLFVSYDKSSGWGEFFRGRLENTGTRIWSSDLLKRRLPYYEKVLAAHIAHAPAALVFISPMHFSTEQGLSERKRELDALIKRFSSMPEKLLIVTTGEDSKGLLATHPELQVFSSFHLETGTVTELWNKLLNLDALPENQSEDAFQDLRQISIPSYDCFISYRTVSVHTVRFLAEQLVARGAKPWFAEWEIMVSGRRGFQEAINHGIASSRNVICCTNSGYAQSEYCQIEAMQVLDVPGKESRHILDLRLPDEPNAISEALQRYGSESVVHEEQILQDTWNSCCRFLGMNSSSLPKRETGGAVNSFDVEGRPFLIALDAGWKIRRAGKQIRGGNTIIAFFSRKVGAVMLEGELVVGPWAIGLPGQTDINDRDMFEGIIATIREWNRHGKILYPRGVHVVHVPALRTASQLMAHPAFTYLDPGTQSGEYNKGIQVPLNECIWHRKYCIRVMPPHMPTEMEFCFDFDMKGVACDDFATFCRYAYVMDDLVRGLQFNN